jgi:hypothetical protein
MRGSNSLHRSTATGPNLLAAAATACFAVTFALLAPSAHAATNTAKPARLHRAQQTAGSTASRYSKPKSAAKPSARPTTPAYRSSRSFAQNKPAPRTRHYIAQPEYAPPVMHRAAHDTPRSRAREAREFAAAHPLTQSFTVHPRLASSRSASRPITPSFQPHPQPAPSYSVSQGQISAQPSMAAKKTLTTEDFVRAAGETGSPQRTATTYVAPYTPAPQPQPQRIEGFGAESAMLAAPRRSIAPVPQPVPSDPSDPDLATVNHPSHEELAESALQPRIPNLYSSDGRLIVPAPLVGSHDVLVHQNEMADAEGLDRIENDDQLASLRAKHLLVDFTESASLQLNPNLADNRRCARPWTVKFATDMARAYYERFHQALQINSAVRTVQYQMRLERTNGNAAGVDGETASPHLTGQAIDFGKRGMSLAQIAWMRSYLKPLMDAGKLDVEEEFRQACFHISVYRSYLPTRKFPPREVAQLSAAGTEQ